MFVCQSCHGDGEHLFISRGPCEVCGKTADCYDCQCSKAVERPILPEAGEGNAP